MWAKEYLAHFEQYPDKHELGLTIYDIRLAQRIMNAYDLSCICITCHTRMFWGMLRAKLTYQKYYSRTLGWIG